MKIFVILVLSLFQVNTGWASADFEEERACTSPSFSGSAGSVATPPTQYIARVYGSGGYLNFQLYNVASGIYSSVISIAIGGGITASGSWGSLSPTSRITQISATGNYWRINGANAILFSGLAPIVSGASSWAGGGVTRVSGAGATLSLQGYDGFSYSTGTLSGTGVCTVTTRTFRTAGMIRFLASAPGATQVEHLVDGVVVATVPSPYTFEYDSNLLTNGRHVHVARATWADGNVRTTGNDQILVKNNRFAPGYITSCAITPTAGKCWGNNSYGQLGNGTTVHSATPVTVTGLPAVPTQIATGFYHACAIASGTVYCWGRNDYGQLGNGTTSNSSVPVAVSLPGIPMNVEVGFEYSCALMENAQVRCWGRNNFGQLGNGTTVDSLTPVVVSGSFLASLLSVGAYSACFVSSTALVQCWGSNLHGELGDGTTTMRTAPIIVSGISSADYVSIEYGHACAVVAGGAKCWGTNSEGQLGNGTLVNSYTPVNVSGLGSGVRSLAATAQSNCAVLSSGAVKCWGTNAEGIVGNGSPDYSTWTTPVDPVGLPSGVTNLATSQGSVCAMHSGALKCWGFNDWGAIGIGTVSAPVFTPSLVVGL